MSFIVKANPFRVGAPAETVNDRVEALRQALMFQKIGYRYVQVIGDGRLYNIPEFAGTISIGNKVVIQ